MLLLSILTELFNFLSGLFLDSDPYTQKAIAPLAVMGIAAGAQMGVGLLQKRSADKAAKEAEKQSKIRESEALNKMKANQQELINRAKVDAAVSGEAPGQNEAEAKIGAGTAEAITSYQEMGNQAGYQDFLNKALQKEQEALTGVYMQQLDYTEGKKAAVTDAISGMGRIAGTELDLASARSGREIDAATASQQAAASNIGGAFSTGASMAMMAASDGGGGGKARAGGGNYRDYKNSGGGMSRREWRNF